MRNTETHTHELFYRVRNQDGTCALTRFAVKSCPTDDVDEGFISLAEGVAADGRTLTGAKEGIVYRVNGQCTFVISKHFFKHGG